MLLAPVSLHDVRDVEATCRSIQERALRGLRAHYLPPDEAEELLADLMAIACQWSLKHDPALGLSFSTYLNRFLGHRVVDWYRRRFGDARYGTPPERVELEDELEIELAGSRANLLEEASSYEEVETRVSLGFGRRLTFD